MALEVTGALNVLAGTAGYGDAYAANAANTRINAIEATAATNSQRKYVVVTPAANTYTPNADTTDYASCSLSVTNTIGTPTGTPVAGQRLVVVLIQDATGGRTTSWAAGFAFGSTFPSPTLTVTALKTDYVTFVWNAVLSKWTCQGIALGY